MVHVFKQILNRIVSGWGEQSLTIITDILPGPVIILDLICFKGNSISLYPKTSIWVGIHDLAKIQLFKISNGLYSSGPS